MQLKLNAKMFLLLTVVYLSVGVVSALIFKWAIPHYYFSLYYVIILFYWVTGIAMNFFLNRSNNRHPDKLLNIYLMARMIKFFLTLVFLLLAVKLMKVPKEPFAISLMANYVIYSGLELYIYFQHNKDATPPAKTTEKDSK